MKPLPIDRRRLRLPGLLAMVWLIAAGSASSASGCSEILEAIHSVENPSDVTRPGRHGELGAYQFRAETWRMHSREPFARALDRAASDAVAARHLEWIQRGLRRHGYEVSPYNIALAWNGGLAATVRAKSPRAAHDYAQRISNLVAEREKASLASER